MEVNLPRLQGGRNRSYPRLPWKRDLSPWGLLIVAALVLDVSTAISAAPAVALACLILSCAAVVVSARWLRVKPLIYAARQCYDEAKFYAFRTAFAAAFTADALWILGIEADPESRRPAQVFPTCASLRVDIAAPCLTYEGGVMVFLPERVVVREGRETLSFGYEEIALSSSVEEVLEPGPVPDDATVLQHTFTFTNKNGSPDLRRKENPPLNLCAYQLISFEFAGSGARWFCQSSAKDVDSLRRSLEELRPPPLGELGANQILASV